MRSLGISTHLFKMPESIYLNALGCFLAGSIPFAVVAMWGSGIDIRQVGSGNPGFNNVLRASKPRAVIALIGDMGKGFLPVWWLLQAGGQPEQSWFYGFAVVFGHCYSPWLKFNGGKGIATSAGVMLVLFPEWAALALGFFVAVPVAGQPPEMARGGHDRLTGNLVVLYRLDVCLRRGARYAQRRADDAVSRLAPPAKLPQPLRPPLT